MRNKQTAVVCLMAIAVIVWWYFDAGQYLQLAVLQDRLVQLRQWYAEHPLQTGLVYFAVYVAVTAASLPGAAILTLAGGALFGFWYGLALVSFASSIGATLAFGVSRVVLRDWVQSRFSRQLQSLNAGFEREGPFYLFTLRLVPLFPFFLINLLMGLLPISVWRFYWVSQIGMLAGTMVFVNAGTHLAEIDGIAGILSPQLWLSFALLGVFPLFAKWLVAKLTSRRVLRAHQRPKSFDTNMIVIGAGSAGLVTALIAATVKAKVTLIEKHKMGGDCLNTGCVPSKALIRSARVAAYARRGPEFGLGEMAVQVDFPAVMSRVGKIIATIEPHDSVERFTGLGVDCVSGEAEIVSPWEVRVGGRTFSARHIVIASGARARVPDTPGLQDLNYLTSDSLWDIREAPRRLLVLGGGPIGCELAQAFARLGVKVALATHAERILPREDIDVSEAVRASFERDGIAVHTGYEATHFFRDAEQQRAQFATGDGVKELMFDRVLLAIGRTANTEGLGIESLGIKLTRSGTIEVNEYLQTALPNIYACGDIVGPYQFTHMASHQAWYAAVNALFGRFKRFRVDYSVVPWATFTDPEVARVGLNETDAKAKDIAYEVTRYDISDLDRAIADGEAAGFVKVLTVPGKDRILGATIVGYHSAELITEFVLAMKHGLGLNKILGTIHIYPTLSESNKFAAGEWRKARKPERVLNLLEKYHAWSRR